MSAPRLVLKQSSGWFAAGWQFSEALLELSDAGFKLYAWLCLNVERHTGRVRYGAGAFIGLAETGALDPVGARGTGAAGCVPMDGARPAGGPQPLLAV